MLTKCQRKALRAQAKARVISVKNMFIWTKVVTLLFEFEFNIWKGSMDSFIPSGRAQLVPIVLFICNIFWKGNEIFRTCGSEQFLTFQLTYTWKQIESCKHLSERVGNSNVESSKKFYCYPWVKCNLIEQKTIQS